MGMRQLRLRPLGFVLGVGVMLNMTGCDYWPPALQAQIEQMRSETQTLSMEKSQLQVQVNDLSKAKQDLQAQVDDLTRMNHEKSAIVASLQKQLDGLRAKSVKGTAHQKTPAKVSAKPAGKQPAKQLAKKKPVTKR